MTEKEVIDEPPPLLPGWNAWYALVLGFLVVLIVLFTWFTYKYS